MYDVVEVGCDVGGLLCVVVVLCRGVVGLVGEGGVRRVVGE